MRQFTELEMRAACHPLGTLLDLRGCSGITRRAQRVLLAGLRAQRGSGGLRVEFDSALRRHFGHLREALEMAGDDTSLLLEGRVPDHPELLELFASTGADVFLHGPEPITLARARALGRRRRGTIDLTMTTGAPQEVLRAVARSPRRLVVRGLRRIDESQVRALLEGTPLRELSLPDLEDVTPRAIRLLVGRKLAQLEVGPVFHNSNEATRLLSFSGALGFWGVKRLLPSQAQALAESPAPVIWFCGCHCEITRDAARQLARYPGRLAFSDLETISEEMAEGLEGFRGDLYFSIRQLGFGAAQRLRSEIGTLEMHFPAEGPRVGKAVIAALVGGGHALTVRSANHEALDEVTASALARHRGRVNLQLRRVASLAAWEAIVRLQGEIDVQRLVLGRHLAEILSRHQGRLALGLQRLPSAAACAELARHRGKGLFISLPPDCDELPAALARELVGYGGELTIADVNGLDDTTVRILARRKGDLRILSTSADSRLQDALESLRRCGALEGG